jgi:diacylglycerol kinase family enzyme
VTFRTPAGERSQLCISTAAIGYAAEVVVLSNRYFKALGPLCYPLAATLQAARQSSFPARVRIDSGPERDLQLSNLMVNNTRHAGNFSAFRASRPDDGRLDVLLARAGFLPQVAHNLAVLTRTYAYATAREFAAAALQVTLPQPGRLMIDGEIWQDVRAARFEVQPAGLQCIA